MPTSYAGSGCPSATSTGPTGTSCCAGSTRPAHRVTIAVVGKYVDLPDAYLSVTEALRAGGFDRTPRSVDALGPERRLLARPESTARTLEGVDGVLVPGGFGVRGIEGKIAALRWARERQGARLWESALACSAW